MARLMRFLCQKTVVNSVVHQEAKKDDTPPSADQPSGASTAKETVMEVKPEVSDSLHFDAYSSELMSSTDWVPPSPAVPNSRPQSENNRGVSSREKPFPERKNLSTKQGPELWHFASNHIMINKERESRGIAPLMRESKLDGIARERAAEMAKACSVDPADPLWLQSEVGHSRVSENIAQGGSIHQINAFMMGSAVHRKNLIDKDFKRMGMGTAKGKDGSLYLCQIFEG